MTFAQFRSKLFARFPQFKTVSDEMFSYFGDETPGNYPLFEHIVVPEIDKAAGADVEDFSALMAFIELVASGDTDCRDLVAIGLGEVIATLHNGALIRSAAGPNTVKAIAQAERRSKEIALHLDRSPIASLTRKLLRPSKKRD